MTMVGIDVSAPGPRVNMAMMKDLLGKRVTLVGRVEGGLQNGILQVKAADEGLVEVVLQGAVPQDAFVEVEGVVESPNTLREQSIIGYGNSFDLPTYNEAIQRMAAEYRPLFYPS